MREIEVKARIRDPKQVLLNLNARGALVGEALTHHDMVYHLAHIPESSKDQNWLRIRTENNARHIFTLKRDAGKALDKIEHETEVQNPKELAKIVNFLGYTLYSDITKTRQKTRIGGIEICLDNVENLGVFIEAEKLVEDDVDGDSIREELWQVLESLGVSKEDEVTKGYDELDREHYPLDHNASRTDSA